jgi:hypothetical protein
MKTKTWQVYLFLIIACIILQQIFPLPVATAKSVSVTLTNGTNATQNLMVQLCSKYIANNDTKETCGYVTSYQGGPEGDSINVQPKSSATFTGEIADNEKLTGFTATNLSQRKLWKFKSHTGTIKNNNYKLY